MFTKKISFKLSSKSCKAAMEKLEQIKSMIPKIEEEFIKESVDWIMAKASQNLSMNYPEYANDFKKTISANWGKIETLTEDMTYIEFGTGLIGQKSSHPEASELGWGYNLPSDAKKEDGSWTFYKNNGDRFDVKGSDIVSIKSLGHAGSRLAITTKGAEAERFMYNAYYEFYATGYYAKLYETIWKRTVRGG